MKKRFFLLLVCLLTLAVSLCLFTACDKGETPDNGGGTTEGGGNNEGGSDNAGNNGGTTETVKPPEKLEYKLSGDGSYYTVAGIGTCTDTELIIPSTYENKPVKEIAAYAFGFCSSLTRVVIPDSVKTIGNHAFDTCYSLTSITIGNSVASIDSYAFFYCKSLTSITIPSSVETIGNSAFCGCDNLVTVNISENSHLLSIGSAAFLNCGSLTSITIPDNVTSIGSSAFEYCDNLTSIVIGKNVTSINDYAFEECYKLVEVINKSSLEITKGSEDNGYVGYYALYVHNGEGKIVNKDGYLFYTLNEVNYLVNYIGTETELTLPSSYNGENYEICKYAFYDNDKITSLIILDSVTSIGDNAFYSSGNLMSVVIGNSVKSIGSYAFYDCDSLMSVTIGNSVKTIGKQAFYYCGRLVEVINKSSLNIKKGYSSYGHVETYALEIHNGESKIVNKDGYLFYTVDGVNYLVNYIGNDTKLTLPNNYNGQNYKINQYAFYSTNIITSVIIPDSVTSIGNYAFLGTACYNQDNWENGVLYIDRWLIEAENVISGAYTIKDGTFGISNYAFEGCEDLTSIEIPNSVKIIGDNSFHACYSLTSVLIPNSVTLIGDCAFYCCDSLTSVVIPNSVTSIGYQAFYYCSSLTSVTIGNSVTSIGSSAFQSCSSLTSVEIPNSVTSISEDAFFYCYKLVEVINKSTLNITKGSYDNGGVGYYALEIHNEESKIVNKDGYLFYTLNGVNYLFGYVGTDTALTLPSDYNGQKYQIYKYAFYENDKITSVIIPDNVTSIGDFAFSGCDSLTSVTIPNSVTSIGDSAFKECTSLTSVTISNSVTSIGDYAFYDCDSLKSIKYRGTEAQWNAISKGSRWDEYYDGTHKKINYTVTYNYTGE